LRYLLPGISEEKGIEKGKFAMKLVIALTDCQVGFAMMKEW
jgi:hypothetical protein